MSSVEKDNNEDCSGSEKKVLSKFLINEKYNEEHLLKIKEAIRIELKTQQNIQEVSKKHYLDNLNQWQKRV